MGEIADDMIDGDCCSWCGLYFKKGHGFPVICRGCFKDWKKEEKTGKKRFTEETGLQVATIEEL